MHSSQAMNFHVYRCHEFDTAQYCAQVMRDQNIGFLPVLDEFDHLVGVLTDRDLAVRVLAEGWSPDTPARDIATHGELLTCGPDDDLHDVERNMALARKARIIVINQDRHCLGVISLSNIAQVEPDARRVKDLLGAVTHREAVQISQPG